MFNREAMPFHYSLEGTYSLYHLTCFTMKPEIMPVTVIYLKNFIVSTFGYCFFYPQDFHFDRHGRAWLEMHPKILNGKIYSKDEMNSAEYLRPSDHKKTDSASVCLHNGWTSFLNMHSRHIHLVSLLPFWCTVHTVQKSRNITGQNRSPILWYKVLKM